MLAMATMYFYLATSVRLCYLRMELELDCIDLREACFVQVYAMDSDFL
jgi:hypothetical protein